MTGWQLQADLTPTDDAPSRARQLLAALLATCPPTQASQQLLEDARLVVTELVTNAVQHAHGSPTIRLQLTLSQAGRLRLSVTDHSTALPAARAFDPAAHRGRGLHLVGQLTNRWGVHRTRTGKLVWAELGNDAESSAPARTPSCGPASRAAETATRSYELPRPRVRCVLD
jgi:anti-sigma regulatory factor (Ser/Thr protein kinase)